MQRLAARGGPFFPRPGRRCACRSRPSRTRKAVLVALFAVLTAVGAFVRVPLPGVPFTLQVPAVLLAGVALGPWLGAASQLAYLAVGLLGLPVFASGGGPGLPAHADVRLPRRFRRRRAGRRPRRRRPGAQRHAAAGRRARCSASSRSTSSACRGSAWNLAIYQKKAVPTAVLWKFASVYLPLDLAQGGAAAAGHAGHPPARRLLAALRGGGDAARGDRDRRRGARTHRARAAAPLLRLRRLSVRRAATRGVAADEQLLEARNDVGAAAGDARAGRGAGEGGARGLGEHLPAAGGRAAGRRRRSRSSLAARAHLAGGGRQRRRASAASRARCCRARSAAASRGRPARRGAVAAASPADHPASSRPPLTRAAGTARLELTPDRR